MGTGSFDDGLFNFVLTSTDAWTLLTRNEWQNQLIDASRRLHEATEGQLRFGEVFMADDGWGLAAADIVVSGGNGTAYATDGLYGRAGEALRLYATHRTGDAMTVVHEFSHHAFSLGDEYAGPIVHDAIDVDAPLPDDDGDPATPPVFDRIPIEDSEHDFATLGNAQAILLFGDQLERFPVISHTPTLVVVNGVFSQDPRTADHGVVFYQPQETNGVPIDCADPALQDHDFCLMGRHKGDPNISEFCSEGNHDPNGDTSHEARHGGLSCWEVIGQTMLARWDHPVAVPDPASPGDVTNLFPTFRDLLKESRIALVMDRSLSMQDQDKIAGARLGIERWMHEAHLLEDKLSVIWFNDEIEPKLSLSPVDPDDVDDLVAEVTDVQADGWTNIRDALVHAVDQIKSHDGRAAVEAIVLLTDGIHTRPLGTSPAEVIPTLQAAGIPVHVIAIGGPDHIDYDLMEALALGTGGLVHAIGAPPAAALSGVIEAAITTTNHLVRNGLVVAGQGSVEPVEPDSTYGKVLTEAKGKRFPLGDVVELLRIRGGVPGLLSGSAHPNALVVPFPVEQDAQSTRFTITHGADEAFHLHLVAPDGDEVDFESTSLATLVNPDRPFATAFVRDPKPGRWFGVVVPAAVGSAGPIHYSAGVVNRDVVVHADCDRQVELGDTAIISAGGTWRDRLSGLRVSARLIGPDGSIHDVMLSDATSAEPGSGSYRGMFTPTVPGRYQGKVEIVARKGRSVLAGGVRRAGHDEDAKGGTLKLGTDAPTFVRRVPIYLDAGPRPKIRDLDDRGTGDRPPAHKKRLGPIDIRRAIELLLRRTGPR